MPNSCSKARKSFIDWLFETLEFNRCDIWSQYIIHFMCNTKQKKESKKTKTVVSIMCQMFVWILQRNVVKLSLLMSVFIYKVLPILAPGACSHLSSPCPGPKFLLVKIKVIFLLTTIMSQWLRIQSQNMVRRSLRRTGGVHS